MRKTILICNTLDHFDSALYSFLVPIFAKLFFSSEDYISQLIYSYSMLVVSGSAKPFGALFFTKIAGKSPIKALKISIYGISITTLSTAVMPTFNSIGFVATLLLVAWRFIIGFFSGGEIAVSRTLIMEQYGSHETAALYESSSLLGIVVASFISWVVILDIISWRIPFIVAGILGFYLYILRSKFSESSLKKQETQYERVQLSQLLVIFFNCLMSNITYTIPFILFNTLIPIVNPSISLDKMMEFNTYLLVFDLFVGVIFSKLQYKAGHIKVIIFCYLILSFLLPFLLPILSKANFITITAIRILIIALGMIACVAQNILFKSISNNYAVIGNTIAISDALLGKAMPAICMAIYNFTQSLLAIGLCISCCSLLCIFFIYKFTKNDIE